MGLQTSIPHNDGLKALKHILDKRKQKHIPTEKLINMVEFVLKKNFFEFNGSVKQQVSGTAIGANCASNYACIYMDEVETEFLKTQERTPLVTFLQELNNFNPVLKFNFESNEKEIPLNAGKINTDLYIKPTDRHQYLHFTSTHPNHTNRSRR